MSESAHREPDSPAPRHSRLLVNPNVNINSSSAFNQMLQNLQLRHFPEVGNGVVLDVSFVNVMQLLRDWSMQNSAFWTEARSLFASGRNTHNEQKVSRQPAYIC